MTNTDALTGKLLEVINQVQGAVSAHSAEAASLVMASTRIDGIHFLVVTLLVFIMASTIACTGARYVVKNSKNKNKEDELALELGIAIPISIITFIIAIMGFLALINPWNWIQVFDPKLYLAHEIIGKVLQ